MHKFDCGEAACNFADFHATIKDLEGTSLPLNEAINTVEAVSKKLSSRVVDGVCSLKSLNEIVAVRR